MNRFLQQSSLMLCMVLVPSLLKAQLFYKNEVGTDSLYASLHRNASHIIASNRAKLPNAKITSGAMYRLIAQSSYAYNAGKFEQIDTADFRYTGKRGLSNVFTTDWDYDSYFRLYYDALGSSVYNEESTVKSYDAKGQLIGQLEQTFPSGNLYKTIDRVYAYNTDGQISYYAYRNKFAPDSLWFSGLSVQKTFDKFGNALSLLDKSWDYFVAKWLTTKLQINEYDTSSALHNRLLSQVYQNWDTTINALKNYGKISYQYDTSGHLLLKEQSFWNDPKGIWIPIVKDTFLYDTKGFNIQIVNTVKDTSALWVNNNNTYIFYDISGNISRTIAQVNVSGSWVNTWQYDYRYVGAKLLMEMHSRWNGTTATFDTSDLYLYSFDTKGNLLSESKEYFNYPPTIFKVHEQYLYGYDTKNNPVEIIYQLKNKSGVWYNVNRVQQSYNADNFITKSVSAHWDGSSWIFNLDSRMDNFYYEETPTQLVDIPVLQSLFVIYPNPSTGTFVIARNSLSSFSGKANQSEPIFIKVYDLLGREVFEQSLILNKAQTPLALNLAKGTFILELSTEEAVQRERIVIQ